jgi:hypothetical protein
MNNERIQGQVRHNHPPYHPEGNSFIESFYRFLRTGFAALACYPVSLAVKLALVMWSYRATPHLAMNETPSYLMLGYDTHLPFECDWFPVSYVDNASRLNAIHAARQLVADQWEATRQIYETQINKTRKDIHFHPNQLILVRNPNRFPSKLEPRWSYPHRVISVINGGRTCNAKSLLTHKMSTVHIENAKFIQRPISVQQELTWELDRLKELEDQRNATLRRHSLPPAPSALPSLLRST